MSRKERGRGEDEREREEKVGEADVNVRNGTEGGKESRNTPSINFWICRGPYAVIINFEVSY